MVKGRRIPQEECRVWGEEHVHVLKARVRIPKKEEIAGGASPGGSWEVGCRARVVGLAMAKVTIICQLPSVEVQLVFCSYISFLFSIYFY